MRTQPVFMTFKKDDIINFVVLMTLAFIIIPMTVKTDYWYTSILIPWLCLSLAAIGQQIVMGYTGQLALGAAGFMAAGAFACFNLVLRVPDLPFVGALALSGLIAAAFGILFGLPSLRVRGIYLMVATLASQFFIIWMIDKFGWFKNYDTSGIITTQDIVIFGKSLTSPMEMFFVLVVIVTVLTLLAMNMARGSTGRRWMAVRDMDIAAESMGISLLRTKLQAFAISAFYCGVAGALFAFTYLKSLEPVAFDIKLSFKILFMVILGGLGTINGAFIGAAFILLFPVVLNTVGNNVFHGSIDATIISATEQVVFGVLIIVFMIYEPLGMAKLWDSIKQRLFGRNSKESEAPVDQADVGKQGS
ncbi:MAG TPA: branched-chain amino acid ABC transporter permease [Rhodospirillaceae bacterium]|nr:branched-chain amino acid ABC transporter permease [Rhodospirillaceae bacterium]MAX62327.1 branched-chain amino acid ABC transporter permease [Rhodospirillaceae bacterium]MBB56284.1 branched-chain amino acid ABC transporter permease [Rhodospirillaceae bacterium]HAE00353.1 branched-chain amino acid ABC transporter permease [Rhodospirillaceae bacterium]HAJ20381.1 branched-chain amino acid ABC transporter permease [Rhodospirillaceae bacterium]|tara:strand:- start:44145 stop:45227 length:1083 start_codon:yes stop_codon:yes gene_type:complete